MTVLSGQEGRSGTSRNTGLSYLRQLAVFLAPSETTRNPRSETCVLMLIINYLITEIEVVTAKSQSEGFPC